MKPDFGFTWEAETAHLEDNVGYLEGQEASVTVFLKDGYSVNTYPDGEVEFVDPTGKVLSSARFHDGE